MSDKVIFNEEDLPQDNWEGVDPDEWVKSFFQLIISFNIKLFAN